MKYLTYLFFSLFAASVQAQIVVQDCDEAGFVNTWLGELGSTVLEKNPKSSKRLADIVSLSNKRDAGKSFEAIKNLYHCSLVGSDPNSSNPNGVLMFRFTEKQFGSSPQDRLKNSPRSFSASLVGGMRKFTTSSNNLCYVISYWNEQGKDVKNDAFLMIKDAQIPFPEKVQSCT